MEDLDSNPDIQIITNQFMTEFSLVYDSSKLFECCICKHHKQYWSQVQRPPEVEKLKILQKLFTYSDIFCMKLQAKSGHQHIFW